MYLDIVVLEGDAALGKRVEVRGDDAAGPVHEVDLVVAEVVCKRAGGRCFGRAGRTGLESGDEERRECCQCST